MGQEMHMDITQLMGQFERRYGSARGSSLYRIVMPGIIADFRKQAVSLKPGARTREEYRLEDGSAIIRMTAEKDPKGELYLTAELQ